MVSPAVSITAAYSNHTAQARRRALAVRVCDVCSTITISVSAIRARRIVSTMALGARLNRHQRGGDVVFDVIAGV